MAQRVGMKLLFNAGVLSGVVTGIPDHLGGDGVRGRVPPAAWVSRPACPAVPK
jgi:hypothetical protein